MRKSVVYKNNIRKWIQHNKLCCSLALGVLAFTFSCKQANTGGVNEPTPSNEIIVITVKSDDGLIVNKPDTIKFKKKSSWKEIKHKAIEKITKKHNKEIKEWRIKDKNGELLEDKRVFEDRVQ